MPRQTNPIERFTSRFVERGPDDCWEWTGAKTRDGYGTFWPDGRAGGKQYGMRFSYEHYVGPIPDGLTLDHLCRNKGCVNPAHLEPVTMQANLRRGEGWTVDDAGQWFCSKGHAIDEAVQARRGTCVECFNSYKREWRKRNLERPTDGARQRAKERERRVRAEEVVSAFPELEDQLRKESMQSITKKLAYGWRFVDGGWVKPISWRSRA